ncbi:hypothetical protein BX600DRAFT_84245 [Xylariales sp. PMI_506]|nr:hypothetical protein BX600DRAFT_84245 [Xylariales sp. PMI_506]
MAVTARAQGSYCDSLDNTFGPTTAAGCRGGFDFTLLFEQAILILLPCALAILLFAARLFRLFRARTVAVLNKVYFAKLTTVAIYAALQLAILVLWTSPASVPTRLSIPTACVSLVLALILGILFHYEHRKSLCPSTLLTIFLTLTALFDICVCRTLWLRQHSPALAAVFTAGLGMKLVLCVLEARPKTLVQGETAENLSDEALCGPYSRYLYLWLIPLFVRGWKHVLRLEDLSLMERPMSSERLNAKVYTAWTKTNQSSRWGLVLALCSALKLELLAPAAARIVLIGFNFSQPFLITAAINYVANPTQDTSQNNGYGLIGASAIIYLGIALSNGQYNYHLYRAITSARGSLVAMIYSKTFELSLSEAEKSASLTLMSADVERIALTCEKIFDIWAGAIETIVAVYLLERQIGWACIAPLLISLACFVGNSTIARFMPARLKQWNQGVQDRVAMTSATIRHIRTIKIMGLGSDNMAMLQDARVHEVERSAHFRWFIAFMNLLGLIPQQLSSPFVFLIFLYAADFYSNGGITASRAFTTLSILELLTNPLSIVLKAIPSVTAAVGCVDRIQAYLTLEDVSTDEGPLSSKTRHVPSQGSESTGNRSQAAIREKKSTSFDTIIASLKGVSLKYKQDSPEVLRNVNLEISEGSLVMIVGPVGSGKSTILKALVGSLLPNSGTLTGKYSDVAYCQQNPWLPNSTIREAITGQSRIDDEKWYQTVKTCCALDEDIARFAGEDEAVIGSSGIILSGGQKQRIALARAVYSRKRFYVLDDVLSALDGKTEQTIFDSLLSKNGLLKQHGATVVLATHAIKHLAGADKIVVLGGSGDVSHVGTYTELQSLPELRQDLITDTSQSPQDAADASKAKGSNERPKTKSVADKQRAKLEARKSAELSDYRDYFRSMGWWRAALFVGMSVLYAAFSRLSQVWLQYFTEGTVTGRGLFIGVYFAFSLGSTALYLISFWWMMIVITPISSADLHWKLLSGVFRAPLSFFSQVDFGVILNRFSQDMAFTNAQLPISTMFSVTIILLCFAQIALISIGSGYLACLVPVLLIVVWGTQKFYLRTSGQLRLLDLENKSPLYTLFTETIEGLATIRAFGWTGNFIDRFHNRLDDSQRPVYYLYLIQRWLNLVLDLIVAALSVLLMVFATQLRNTSSGPALGVAMVNILSFSQNLGQLIFFYTELETSLGAMKRIKEYAGLTPEDPPGATHPPPEQWPSQGSVSFKNVSAAYDSDDAPVLKDVSFDIASGQMVGISGRTGSGKSSLLMTLLGFLELRSGSIEIDGVDVSTMPREEVRTRITTIPQDPYFPEKRKIRLNLAGSESKHTDAALIAALDKVGLLPHMVAALRPGASSSSPGAKEEIGGGGGDDGDGDGNGDDNKNEAEKSGGETTTAVAKLTQEDFSALLDAEMKALPLSPGQLQLFCLARALLRDSRVVLLDEVTSAVDHATEEKLRSVLREEMRGKTVVLIAHRPDMIAECQVVVEMEDGRVARVRRNEAAALISG